MYILYLDESGTHQEASYFVLAGLAVFEREIYWFSQDLDSLQKEYFPAENKPVHFHARTLRVSNTAKLPAPLNQLTKEQLREIKDKVYEILRKRGATLFGCAIEKKYAALRHEDPYEWAFEDLISRFDMFLSRINRAEKEKDKEEQRGLVVLAESNYKKTISLLAQRLQQTGTRWRSIHNVTDIPMFAPSPDSRMLQYADFCANAIYGRYETGHTLDFDKIASKFDRQDSAVHGLSHLSNESHCVCLACISRH